MEASDELQATERRVLEIFERHRKTPGAPYDASHFLDFLLPEPERKSALHDSFAGKRRFNRFVDDLQLELCVCLTNEDLERAWSPRALAQRISHKQGNPQADLRLVAKRSTAERAAWTVPTLFLNLLVGAPLLGIAGRIRSWPVGIAAVSALVLLNGGFWILRRRALQRWRRLEEALRATAAHEPGASRDALSAAARRPARP